VEDRLILEGAILIALFTERIQFHRDIIGRVLHMSNHPPTGFGAAIAEANLISAYTGAHLTDSA
jgi:hypothetical protein